MDEGKRFHGAVVKQWRAGKLNFSESVFPPGATIARHAHPLPYFSILLQGSYRETYSAGVRECTPATAVLHPPGEVHADRFLDAGGRIFRFEMTGSDTDFYFARIEWDTAEIRSGRVRCLAARLYRESCRADRFSPLAAEALALEIIGEATRHKSPCDISSSPAWLKQATELLHETLPENLTVHYVAGIVDIHPVHLARVFRRRFGCTMGEYTRNWRIELASRRLANNESAIAEVAAAAGFADQSHLCRTFKAAGGLTPREYRMIFHA